MKQSEPSPLQAVLRPGETAERLIKRFTRLVRSDGVLRELRDRRGFLKPSQKRRRKHARALFSARRS